MRDNDGEFWRHVIWAGVMLALALPLTVAWSGHGVVRRLTRGDLIEMAYGVVLVWFNFGLSLVGALAVAAIIIGVGEAVYVKLTRRR